MAFKSSLKELLTFQAPVEQTGEQETPSGQPGQKEKKEQPEERKRDEREPELTSLSPPHEIPPPTPKNRFRRPVRAASWPKHHASKAKTGMTQKKIAASLKVNITRLKEIFHLPQNRDVVFRDFSIGTNPPVTAALIFVDGLTDRNLQNSHVLEPLMLLSRLRLDPGPTLLETVMTRLLPGNQAETTDNLNTVVDAILDGSTAILIDFCPKAIFVETKGWEHRTVSRPTAELVIRGPQEGFTETLRVNTALIRRSFHSPDLVTEFVKIGRLNRINCAVMYVKGLTDPKLAAEVKNRLNRLATDYIGESGVLEQFIEDNTFGFVPQILTTERPDRVVAGLTEGQVALLLEGNPFALLVPATFFALFHTAEDAYIRWPYGTILRFIRLFGFFMAIFLPGIYIAVIGYHHEMIPTDLLMSIAAAHENVPFPSVIELVVMEIIFELIREAGIRIPGLIGPTLSIVGALILGQAAVAANIISPILIIVVAITAIGSFAVPNYILTFSVRLLQFIYIFLGAVFGVWGLVIGVYIQLLLLAGIKSFGVPFLAPLATIKQATADVFIRGPVWKQEERPGFLKPQRRQRQPTVSRMWLKRPKKGNFNAPGK
ncbi:MAG TPA: spore germination protein [Desulfotomaculum sp.]|nr:spore germination protein [Desulfotomaculum sp.]